MSVFPRGKKGIYAYSFQIRGQPFFGSTGCTTKREALAVEAQAKQNALDDLKKRKAATTGPLSFDAALEKLWSEVGTYYRGTYRKTVATALAWLLEKSGIRPNTLIRDIGPALINEAIARRRGEGVSNATVNRTVTELLRLLLIRARDGWEQKIKPPEWKKHLLDEPQEYMRGL